MLGSGPVVTSSSAFVQKLSPSASVVWSYYFNSNGGGESSVKVDVDSIGNVYVAGQTQSTTFEGNTRAGTAGDAFLVKLNSIGSVVWATRFSSLGDNTDGARAVAVDSIGNIIVAGGQYESASLLTDMMAAKYGPSGEQLWFKMIPSTGATDEWVTGLALDTSNNVYLASSSGGQFNNENSETTPSTGGTSQIVIVKLDSSTGSLQWLRQVGVEGSNDLSPALVFDSVSSRLWIGGETKGAFDGFSQAGGGDIFITAYDTNGNAIAGTTNQFGSTNSDSVSSIALARDARPVLFGVASGSVDGVSGGGGGVPDMLLALYQNTQVRSTTMIVPSPDGSDAAGGIVSGVGALDVFLYIGGRITGAARGESFAGSNDVLVSKMHPCTSFGCDGNLSFRFLFPCVG